MGGLLGVAKGGLGGLLGKAGAAIMGSKVGVTTGGLLGKIGGVLSVAVGFGIVKAIGGAANGGLGILSSIWGPIAGSFETLLSEALLVVSVVSSIITVASLLGDNLEYIREVVGGVFGE